MPPPFASTGLTGRRLSVEEAGGWVNQFTNSRGDLGFVDIVANKNMSSLCVFVSACVEVGLSVVHLVSSQELPELLPHTENCRQLPCPPFATVFWRGTISLAVKNKVQTGHPISGSEQW